MIVVPFVRQAAFWTLSHLPGKLGDAFETRWHWARRRTGSAAARTAFRDCLSSLDASKLCLDLGANVGVVSERLAQTGAEVHAFEPDPWAFEQLRNRLAGFSNVVLHNAAIGAEDGHVTLMRDPGFATNQAATSQGTSAYSSLLWHEGEPEPFEAEMIDIRRFLGELGRPVDLMKVDIEGAEADLLEALLGSAVLEQIRVMFVETHEAQIPELRPRLKSLRRRISELERPVIHLDWQ